MPKITIREIDKTKGDGNPFQDYTVLIPVKVSVSKPESKLYIPGKDTYTASAAPTLAEKMISKLLDVGLPVLVYKTANLLDKEEYSSLTLFEEEFSDKGLWDIRFITLGDFESEEDKEDISALIKAAVNCAYKRGDAVALLSDLDGIDTAISGITVDAGKDSGTAGKYAACFANTFTLKEDEDKTPKTNYPGWFGYLLCFGTYINSYSPWYAMAGSVRGRCSALAIDSVDPIYGDAKIQALQPREGTAAGVSAKNVIANIRPYGDIIWGNRTLEPIKADGLTASHFLNIRQLCCTLKKIIYKACRKFTFEPNSDVLWVRFCNEITPTLEKMKSDQGIRGYKLIQKTDAKRAELKAIIKIIPIEAVEDFDITVLLADSIEVTE